MPRRSWQRPPSASIPYCERVVRDRRHRAQVGERRPEPIVGRDVGPVKLLRPRCPEALARVVEVPGVEVGHLGPLDGDDPAQLAGADGPRAPRPDGHHEAVDEGPRRRSRGRGGRRRRGPPRGARSGSRGDRSRVATSSASGSECAGATLARAPEASPPARARGARTRLRRSASRRGPPGRRGGCGAGDRAGRGSRRRSEARAPPRMASGAREARHRGEPVGPGRRPGPAAAALRRRASTREGRARGRRGERGRAPASRACAGRAGGIGSANPDTTSHREERRAAASAGGARQGAPRGLHVSVTASERRRHTTACGVRAGRWNSVPGSRSKVRHPASRPPRGAPVVELFGGARAAPGVRWSPSSAPRAGARTRRPRRRGGGPCPPVPLPRRRTGTSTPRGRRRDRSEEGAPEADHEPHQARQHLVHLREIGRLPGRQGGRQTPRVARPVDLALRGDLERKPAAGHPDACGEVGRDGAPCPVARPEDGRHAARGLAGETLPARGRSGNQLASGRHHRARRLEPAGSHARSALIGPSCRRIGETAARRTTRRADRAPASARSEAPGGRAAAAAVERKGIRAGIPSASRHPPCRGGRMIVEAKLASLGLPLPDLEADYRKNRSGARFVSHRAVGSAPLPVRHRADPRRGGVSPRPARRPSSRSSKGTRRRAGRWSRRCRP